MENEPLDMMFRLFTKGKLCENFNIYFLSISVTFSTVMIRLMFTIVMCNVFSRYS